MNERDVHEKLHIYDSYPNKTNDYDDEGDQKEEKNFKSLPELNERDVFEKLDFSSCDSNQKTDGMVTIPSIKNSLLYILLCPDQLREVYAIDVENIHLKRKILKKSTGILIL